MTELPNTLAEKEFGRDAEENFYANSANIASTGYHIQ